MPAPLGALASIALVAVAVVLAVTGSTTAGVDTSPHLVGSDDLVSLEGRLGHSVYWAGERPGTELELREEEEGSVFLRYLPAGVEAGDPREDLLTVGTYPVADAITVLRRSAAKTGSPLRFIDGAIVLVDRTHPGSVYLVPQGSSLEVEVYDPRPGRSLRLVRAGAIRPVGEES